jgi:hypothetical protein
LNSEIEGIIAGAIHRYTFARISVTGQSFAGGAVERKYHRFLTDCRCHFLPGLPAFPVEA